MHDDYPICAVTWCTDLGEADGLCVDHYYDMKEQAA